MAVIVLGIGYLGSTTVMLILGLRYCQLNVKEKEENPHCEVFSRLLLLPSSLSSSSSSLFRSLSYDKSIAFS
jgi:hypothetical protein